MGFITKEGLGAIIALLAVVTVGYTGQYILAFAGIMYILWYLQFCYKLYASSPEMVCKVNELKGLK